MKKNLVPQECRKLSLSRETLHNLEKPELAPVVGGITAAPSGCIGGSCGLGCNSRGTCTTFYC
jgi:hypothetical protein